LRPPLFPYTTLFRSTNGGNRMRTVVVGGGVVGLTTAYELAVRGHEVTVIEAERCGAGASHGNAAKIAIAESNPVPAPGVVLQGIKWMLRPDSPLSIKPSLAPGYLKFLLRMADTAMRVTSSPGSTFICASARMRTSCSTSTSDRASISRCTI